MKKSFGIMMAMALNCLPIAAFEGYAEIDGINYYILTKGAYAEVAFKSSGYTGDVVIPSSVEYEGVTCTVTAIRNSAFYYESNLNSVSIPNTVESIGISAFEGSSMLKTVNIPQSVTSIGQKAFYRCEGLETVKADNIESWCKMEIGQDASPLVYAQHLYFGNTEVTDLQIPSSVTSVCGRAFHGYKGLKSVTFDTSVTSVGDYAFHGCTELATVSMSNSISDIGTFAFYGCTALTTLTLSEGLNAIKQGCFYGCSKLTNVSVPNSVTIIERDAFKGCSAIKKVYIGNGILKIGMTAFSNCSDITDVYCSANVSPKLDAMYYKDYTLPFYGSHIEYTTLHVPESSITDYQSNVIWNGFGNIVALTEGDTGISTILYSYNANEVSRFTINGLPTKNAIKGVNIIRMKNGASKKVVVK